MEPIPCDKPTLVVIDGLYQQEEQAGFRSDNEVKLHRWLVSFASGGEWYPVGEFAALDAASAIERAIEIFGCAADHRAEEIPWDAAPLPRPKPLSQHWHS
jgi:hypothetical protein